MKYNTRPEIRFSVFESEWKKRSLDEAVRNIGTGKSKYNVNEKSIHNYIPILGSTSIIGYDEAYDYEGDFILTARVGANAGNLYRYYGRAKITDNTVYIQGDNLLFLFPLLTKYNLKRLSFGTGMPLVKSSELKKLKIYFPSIKEQQKIGEFFKQLDDRISLQQRHVEQLKQSKQGFLQKMFPKDSESVPEVRFDGFNGEWEYRTLSDISDKVTEKNKDNIHTETLTNSAEYGIINQREFFDKDISNDKNLKGYYVVRQDDFVYNPRISNFAPVGPIKRNKLGRTGVMSPLYYVFRTYDIDKTYLEYYFDGKGWHMFMKLNGDSGARADRFAIKDFVFKEMPIPYPCNKEQQKIGEFFKQLDDLITKNERELELLQETKKGFLQKMFV